MLHTILVIIGLVIMANIFYFIIILALKCCGIVEWRSSKKRNAPPKEEVVHLVNHPIKKAAPVKSQKKPKNKQTNQKPQTQPKLTTKEPQNVAPFQPDISDVSDSMSTLSGHAPQPQISETASPTFQRTANQNSILDDLRNLSFFSKNSANQPQNEEENNQATDKLSLDELQLLMKLKDLRDLQLYQRLQEIRQLKELMKAERQNEIQRQVQQGIQELLPQIKQQLQQQQQQKKAPKKQKTK